MVTLLTSRQESSCCQCPTTDAPRIQNRYSYSPPHSDSNLNQRSFRMSAPFYGKGPEHGFHVLKDTWCQKRHLQKQSDQLVEDFSTAIKATQKAVPSRRRGFGLSRGVSVKIDASERERIWERSLFIRWSAAEMASVTDCWDHIVAFQVPLFASRRKEGLGLYRPPRRNGGWNSLHYRTQEGAQGQRNWCHRFFGISAPNGPGGSFVCVGSSQKLASFS